MTKKRKRRKNTAKLFLGNVYVYGVLTAFCVVALFPLYWIVSTSFKTPTEFFGSTVQWIFMPTLRNYKQIMLEDTFLYNVLNSAIISTTVVFLTLVIGSLAGYAIARFDIKHKDDFFFFVLTTRMAPPVAFGVPLYLLLAKFGLIDTRIGIVLVYVFMNLAFCIWLTRSFFEEIPLEMEEAAILDGCSRLGAFVRIILPLTSTGLIATAVLMFVFTWNEFFFAMVLTRSYAQTFTVHLQTYFGWRRILWGELTAASTVGVIIPIVFASIMRRYLIRGMTLGIVK